MANRNRANKLVVPGAENLLNQMKLEIAKEFGYEDYDNMDKGSLPSRINGAIGGTMTKRLIEMGQQMLAGQNINQSNLDVQEYAQEAQQDLQNAQNEVNANVTPQLLQ